ncbi:MAG: hypothetical protein N3I35_05330 [Clostridia bacterium]|nr:hypothetical protein [Clostridia bacterium]
MKLLSIITLILVIITIGCGFAIHFGGQSFRDGIKGHMVLGILTLISTLVLCIYVLVCK